MIRLQMHRLNRIFAVWICTKEPFLYCMPHYIPCYCHLLQFFHLALSLLWCLHEQVQNYLPLLALPSQTVVADYETAFSHQLVVMVLEKGNLVLSSSWITWRNHQDYHIWSNYLTYPISTQSSDFWVFRLMPLYFCLLLYVVGNH